MAVKTVVGPREAPIRDLVSADEWGARVELAALYRAIHYHGMTDLIANHITARAPGTPDHILINPFGVLHEEITASSLYKIDLEGNVILKPAGDYRLNVTGYVIHGAIHAARPDLNVIIHTHTRAGVAVAAMECGLLPISQQAALLHGCVAYHDYEGPSTNHDEQARLIADLGGMEMMILRNHGLIACGPTVAKAFLNIFRLETACQIQVDAMAAGRDRLRLIDAEALAATRAVLEAAPERGGKQWRAVMRQIDRVDASYRN